VSPTPSPHTLLRRARPPLNSMAAQHLRPARAPRATEPTTPAPVCCSAFLFDQGDIDGVPAVFQVNDIQVTEGTRLELTADLGHRQAKDLVSPPLGTSPRAVPR